MRPRVLFCLAMLGLSVLLQAQFRAARARVSQGYAETLVVSKMPPTYPTDARKKHIEGNVVLQVEISKEGLVETVKVLSGDPMCWHKLLRKQSSNGNISPT